MSEKKTAVKSPGMHCRDGERLVACVVTMVTSSDSATSEKFAESVQRLLNLPRTTVTPLPEEVKPKQKVAHG